MREPHGVPGQMNIFVLDKDSDITGFGKHNRLTVSQDVQTKLICIREDMIGLPRTTEADRMKVTKGYQRLHPRNTTLVPVETEEFDGSIWYIYRIQKKG